MKFKNYYGIDISKDFFDVMDQDGRHMQFAILLKALVVPECNRS